MIGTRGIGGEAHKQTSKASVPAAILVRRVWAHPTGGEPTVPERTATHMARGQGFFSTTRRRKQTVTPIPEVTHHTPHPSSGKIEERDVPVPRLHPVSSVSLHAVTIITITVSRAVTVRDVTTIDLRSA